MERAFEDAKSECGMADYQVRKWNAWHHHMALVMMAMLFMLSERTMHEDTYPMLSRSDIEDLLSRFLPRRDVRKEESSDCLNSVIASDFRQVNLTREIRTME